MKNLKLFTLKAHMKKLIIYLWGERLLVVNESFISNVTRMAEYEGSKRVWLDKVSVRYLGKFHSYLCTGGIPSEQPHSALLNGPLDEELYMWKPEILGTEYWKLLINHRRPKRNPTS